MSSLATQLKNAKLKSRNSTAATANKKPNVMPASTVTENSGSSTSSGGSGNYGTIGRATPMASMLDEMEQTLARRRERQQEKKEPDSNNNDSRSRMWEKSNTLPHKLGNSSTSQSLNTSTGNGAESPKPSRKRFGSASEETILKQVNGEGFSLPNSVDMENLEARLTRIIRTEIAKAKQEILDAIISELNRR